jgi:hypothetical protein
LKNILFLLIPLLISSCATQSVNRFSKFSDSELADISKLVLDEAFVQYCNRLLPLSTEISKRDPTNSLKSASKYFAEYQCDISEGRWQDAYVSLLLSEKYYDKSSGSIGFYVAYKAEKYIDAVARLESLSDSFDILKITPMKFWGFYDDLISSDHRDLKERIITAMAYSPYFHQFELSFREAISIIKLSQDVSKGDYKNSKRWISEIILPSHYISMLADKKYELLWPELEKEAGPNFLNITNKYVNAMTVKYKKDPLNLEAYLKRSLALLFAGEFEKLIEFVETPERGKYYDLTLNEAWAINAKVYALDTLGRHDEAENLFEQLATSPVGIRNKYWLINFTINRASRLMRFKKWKKGYKAVVYAENFSGSPYAEMIILKLKACSLIKLKKEEEAGLILDKLLENRTDNYISAAGAMLCSARNELASTILIEGLKDENNRGNVLEALQKPEFSFYFKPSPDESFYNLIEQNDSLKEAFREKGRLIPDKFMLYSRIKKT